MHFIFFSFGGWALIRGWALINFFYLQGGRLFESGHLIEWIWYLRLHKFNGKSLKKGIYIELSQLILLPKPIIVSGIVFPMLFYLWHFSDRKKTPLIFKARFWIFNFGLYLDSLINDHFLAYVSGHCFVNSIFYSLANFVLSVWMGVASMKREAPASVFFQKNGSRTLHFFSH